MELRDAIIFFGLSGQGVKLEGLGTYLPNIRLDGSLDAQHRLDPAIRKDINRRAFTGTVLNRKHIGKTADELVILWNAEHPDDAVL